MCVTVEERFLLIDTSPVSAPNRVLVFGREANMDFAADVTTLYIDGTFKLAPLLFKKVYIMLAERIGHVFPLLYCWLVNKQRRTYQQLFHLLHTTWPELNVSSCILPKIWGFIAI